MLTLCSKNLAMSYQKGRQDKEAVEAYIRSSDYTKPSQRMSLYFTIANIYDDRLDDPQNALIYYTYYRNALYDYVESLKKKTEENDNVRRIKDSESRIKALDEHILELKGGKKNGRKSFNKKQGTQITRTETGKSIITKNENGKIIIMREENGKIISDTINNRSTKEISN
jgi:hypothetical protein